MVLKDGQNYLIKKIVVKLNVELKKLNVELKKLNVELKKLNVELKKLNVELKKLRAPWIAPLLECVELKN